ncbi:hypothetical protein [Mucilaginibacter lappiensis]|uniref:Uncharacterized protein n=1 Tax=Mucilaginibacter lappiensis TaxID=354630 RepID=A0A841JKY4_9SPHI|nr:hypothetical protein [Mucilaginibacter lappiensis]MBB6131114.1 hypothetical protein [Mucilaginibacter lappiensis]
MKQQNYTRYYRVFKNDTVITEFSANDFQSLKLKASGRNWIIGNTGEILGAIADIPYVLPPLGVLYYGYKTQAEAMEGAKAGALCYINSLIAMGEAGEQTLIQYRMDHYEDLNINLVEANIYEVENNLPGAVDQHLL